VKQRNEINSLREELLLVSARAAKLEREQKEQAHSYAYAYARAAKLERAQIEQTHAVKEKDKEQKSLELGNEGDHGDDKRNGVGKLRPHLIRAGLQMGRDLQDLECLADTLESNWYDTLDSIQDLTNKGALELGVPLRLVQMLREATAKDEIAKDGTLRTPKKDVDSSPGVGRWPGRVVERCLLLSSSPKQLGMLDPAEALEGETPQSSNDIERKMAASCTGANAGGLANDLAAEGKKTRNEGKATSKVSPGPTPRYNAVSPLSPRGYNPPSKYNTSMHIKSSKHVKRLSDSFC